MSTAAPETRRISVKLVGSIEVVVSASLASSELAANPSIVRDARTAIVEIPGFCDGSSPLPIKSSSRQWVQHPRSKSSRRRGSGASAYFRGNPDIERLARGIYEDGGIVSSICHGPASLLDVKLSNGQYLIQGKNVTSFTDSEEGDMKMLKVMPFLLETELRKRGVTFHASENWTSSR